MIRSSAGPRTITAALATSLLAAALFAVPASAKPVRAAAANPQYSSLMQDVLINADYWDKKPKMLAAGLGFTNILGVTNADSTDLSVAQAAVQAVSGAWNVGMTCSSTSTPPQRAYTSAASPSQILDGYGASRSRGSDWRRALVSASLPQLRTGRLLSGSEL